jgi:hypothetical protein
VSVGATRYEFSGHNRVLTTAYNTTELFAGSRFDAIWGTPSITANWDVQTIHGVYVEGAVAHEVPLGRFTPLVGVVAGYTAGQEAQGALDQYFAFARRGLTHVDVSASSTFNLSTLTIAPVVHVQLSPSGQNTRAVGARASQSDRAAKLWFGVDVGWARRGDAP